MWWLWFLIFLILAPVIWWLYQKRGGNLMHGFRDLLRARKLLVVIIFLLVVVSIGVGIWWVFATQQAKTPERQYEITFVEEVLPNVKGIIFLKELKEKLQADEIEIVYRQAHPREHTTLTKYYLKYKGEDDYYLYFGIRGIQVVFEGKTETVSMLLDDALKRFNVPVMRGDRDIKERVLPNVKGDINADTFEKKLKAGEIELVFTWWSPGEPEHYVKLKDEEGYYTFVRPFGYIVKVEVKRAGMLMPLDLAFQQYSIAPRDVPTYPKGPGLVSDWRFQLGLIVLLVVGIGGGAYWLHRKQMGGGFLKSCADRFAGEEVTFDDVAGLEEEKEEMREVVDFVNQPEELKALGAKIPKGVLLVGPPGNGKTLLARAVSAEAKVPFLSISGSEFVEMFVGVGAARIRDLFDEAKRLGRCIIFIDEVDAVAKKREAVGLSTGGRDERETTLNQLLVEMDGLESGKGITVITATNRRDLLDEAFTRPGRIDREVFIGHPNLKGREDILRVHAKEKPIAEGASFRKLAQSVPLGTSGADLANIVNEAAIHAGRNKKKEIGNEDFQYARDKIMFGPEKKSRELIEREKEITAYHEAGHALVAKLLPNIPPLNRVSIVPRGESLGQTQVLPEEDRYIRTKEEILDNIAYCMGSIAAEKEGLDIEGSTGAANDIEKATELAMGMITIFGMSKTIGLVSLKKLIETGQATQVVNDKVVEEVNEINSRQLEKVKNLISENKNKPKLKALVKVLRAIEDVDGEMANRILDEEELVEKILAADEKKLDGIIKTIEEQMK